MPNWCSNQATIHHSDPLVILKITEAFKEGNFFNTILPMPENPTVEHSGVLTSMPDWYQWRVQNWGTKWDVGGDGSLVENSPTEIDVSFDSAWGPPIELYQKMVDDLGFTITAQYHEYGMCFYGTFEDGVDSYGEYSKFDEIPVGIVNTFGLVDYSEE